MMIMMMSQYNYNTVTVVAVTVTVATTVIITIIETGIVKIFMKMITADTSVFISAVEQGDVTSYLFTSVFQKYLPKKNHGIVTVKTYHLSTALETSFEKPNDAVHFALASINKLTIPFVATFVFLLSSKVNYIVDVVHFRRKVGCRVGCKADVSSIGPSSEKKHG